MMFNKFPYYRKHEKIAIITLLFCIVFMLVLLSIDWSQPLRKKHDAIDDTFVEEFEQFKREHVSNNTNGEDFRNNNKDYRSSDKKQKAANIKNEAYSQKSSNSSYSKSHKLEKGQSICINGTDTTEWKKIPGIGSAYADRIVKYRQLLGGFVSVNQLEEVYGIDNEKFLQILPFLKEGGEITKVNINHLDFKELLRHPYLNYNQVKAIVNLRKKKGDILSLAELEMMSEFEESDIQRLRHYLVFN